MPENIPFEQALATSVEGIVLEKTRDRLLALALPAIGERVYIQKLPWLYDETLVLTPCAIISPAPETTAWQEGSNESDDTILAVLITLVLANGLDVTTKGMGLHLSWRQTLRRRFINKSRLTWSDLATGIDNYNGGDGTRFIHAWIESGDKFIELAKREQRDASYYLLRVRVREPRETD
jgi:hypothetical protein